MKFDFNIADFFKLPTKIMFGIAIASGMILFFPNDIIDKMYMLDFRNNYGFTIGLIFLTSISILSVTFIICCYKYFSNKHFTKKFKSTAKERLQKLDDYQKAIVYELYKEDNHTAELPLYDGAVKWLKQNIIIIETTSQYIVSDLNNAAFPYMLQPWVIEQLQNNKDLLICFRNSHDKINEKYNQNNNLFY